MDLYDDSRTLVYSGPVARRSKSETGFSDKWLDYSAALLDNYCELGAFSALGVLSESDPVLLMQEDKRPNGVIRRYLVSRVRFLTYDITYLVQTNQYHMRSRYHLLFYV